MLKKFKVIVKQENIAGDELNMYKRGIVDEMKVIKDTKEINTADYFLLNEKLVDLAVNKYNGVLTKTGRGCFTKRSFSIYKTINENIRHCEYR